MTGFVFEHGGTVGLALVAQSVEHLHGKEGVISSSLIEGSYRFSFFIRIRRQSGE